MYMNSTLYKIVEMWSSVSSSRLSSHWTEVRGVFWWSPAFSSVLKNQGNFLHCSELALDHWTGAPAIQRSWKTSVRSSWTEIRTELKGTLGDDLEAFWKTTGKSLLAGSTISSILCTKAGKQESPLLYTFQCANGDERVSRCDLSSFQDLARTNREWGTLDSAAYCLVP